MASRARLVAALLLWTLVHPVAVADTDGNCGNELEFPADCVEQLGAIGDPPPGSTTEGYLGIVSPVVDPLLRLETDDARNGRLYAVHPASNVVRVFAPDGIEVLADLQVCYRPSALAQDATGDRVFVSCHASNAVGIVDTGSNLLVGVVQDRDELGRPELQEPMGLVFSGGKLYVASSQNHRVAVIDPAAESVLRYIDIPGQEPRSMALTDDGAYLIVANFLAGNRTEPAPPETTGLSEECEELLEDPLARDVFREDSASFMDTTHPDYPEIAECYFKTHMSGISETVVRNPLRPDHDLVVVRLSDEEVVFTTDSLVEDPGTLNYGVAVSGSKVYLATVHARNDLNADFGNRPMVNRLAVFDLDPSTGQLELASWNIRDLDEPFLDADGDGASLAATPYAVAAGAGRVLVAAAGSDHLVLTDPEGNMTGTIPVGFGPKGVVADGDTAWVYNATGLSLSRADLNGSTSVEIADLGPSPVPETVRIGARLFDSARFAANRTFSCASCHPDGHMDGLVWQLNEQDGLRATMTVRQISEESPYHWDGSKCNLIQILEDGITGLFGSPAPTDCEMKVMIDYIEGLVHPRTPHRPLDDSMTAGAALGMAVMHRAGFLGPALVPRVCNNRPQDMTVEGKILEAAGDPGNNVFEVQKTCGKRGCHVAPHMGTGEETGDVNAFAPTFLLGMWDRNVTLHDGRITRSKLIEAVEINRVYHGAEPIRDGDHFTGALATLGFQSLRNPHTEFNFDDDPATHAFSISDATGRFILEAQELQSGVVGLTFVLRSETTGELPVVDLLESSADQGKVTLLGAGTLGGEPVGLTWQPADSIYETDGGDAMTRAELLAALTPGDALMLYGGLLPGQNSSPSPKIKKLRRVKSPYICSEDYLGYPAAVEVGELDVPIRIAGPDLVDGSRVLVDGQVTGAPLNVATMWKLPAAPPEATVLSIQVLAPTGMLSNTLPLPVVDPVVPPDPVQDLFAEASDAGLLLFWKSQFGVTGPGTQYDLHRGRLSELREFGLSQGICRNNTDATIASYQDAWTPAAGEGFYYVVRAENQLGDSGWGTPERDEEIETCPSRYP